MDTNEIVKALRCSAQIPSNEEQCAGCPYFVLEHPSEDDVKELGLEPEWQWKGCNVDRMALDAADRIEKQDAEIKVLRDKVPEWIPVAERLPEIGVRVLTLDKWGHIRDRVYKSYTNGKPYFYPDGLEPGRDIKAWMPVPEEEKDEK